MHDNSRASLLFLITNCEFNVVISISADFSCDIVVAIVVISIGANMPVMNWPHVAFATSVAVLSWLRRYRPHSCGWEHRSHWLRIRFLSSIWRRALSFCQKSTLVYLDLSFQLTVLSRVLGARHNTLYTVVKVKRKMRQTRDKLFPFIPNAYLLRFILIT